MSKMQDIISLCKQRGFVFQSSEIYGGLKSCYDYGPLGVELKRNISNEWWRSMVHSRPDVHGLDASIIMHTDVWKASGHLDKFNDKFVDCCNMTCRHRFRTDKAPKLDPNSFTTIEFPDKGKAKEFFEMLKNDKTLGFAGATNKQFSETRSHAKRVKRFVEGVLVGDRGYVCPKCGSSFLTYEKEFNLMFKTNLGPTGDNPVYLRPETAQAMFVQFKNLQRTANARIPFGIAQIGKSFRNEITTEHFIFRSAEFEQMEMEFFVRPGEDEKWFDYWRNERLNWWRQFANNPDDFRLRDQDEDERAHYAKACSDIEYNYPWGWDELEGIANRTDYDLKNHREATGADLMYSEQIREGDKNKTVNYLPYVIEPAAGLTRGVLCYLADAYAEDKEHMDEKGRPRKLLRLHPRLAPIKVAILPLVKKGSLPEIAEKIFKEFCDEGINAQLDIQHSIGRRYRRHDEIGTPYALTVDFETLEDDCVTIRDRNSTKQRRISIRQAVNRTRIFLESDSYRSLIFEGE